MFTIKIDDEALLGRLREMLEEEDDDTAAIRIREYKLGGGCRTRFILGLGIDNFDEDEDIKIEIKGIPFIAASDIPLRYGNEFLAHFNEQGQIVVKALAENAD